MMALVAKKEPEDRSVQSLLPQQHTLKLSLGAGAPVSPVTSLAFSPDGSLLASGSLDNMVRLWNLRHSGGITTLAGHSGVISSVAFGPNGQLVASGSHDCTVRLWNVPTGRQQLTLEGHGNLVSSVAFSSNGQFIVSGSYDGTIRIWDTKDGEATRILTGHQGPVWSVAVSPNDQHIVSGSADKLIKVWDVHQGTEIHSLPEQNHGITRVAYSPDGHLVACAGYWGALGVWNTRTWELKTFSHGHGGRVLGLAFHPQGQIIVSSGDDQKIEVWNARTGKQLRALEGHAKSVFSAIPSPDGRLIASGSFDTSTKLWEFDSGKQLASLTGIGESDWVVVAPDCQFDASPGAMPMLHWVFDLELFELDQLKPRFYEPGLMPRLTASFAGAELPPEMVYLDSEPTGPIAHLRLTNRGGGIGRVAVYLNGEEVVSDARGGEPDPQAQELHVDIDLSSHPALEPDEENNVEIKAYNAQGYLAGRGLSWACGTSAFTVISNKPELVAETGGHHHVNCVAFSPDGKILASGHEDMNVELRDMATGTQIRTLRGHSASISCLAFGADGRTLASGSKDGAVKLWDITTGRLVHSLTALPGKVVSIAFHQIKQMLVAGSDDGAIGIWDLPTGTELQLLRTQAGSVALSPDAKMVAAGGRDGIAVWDVVSGNRVSSISALVCPVKKVWGDHDSDSTMNLVLNALALDSSGDTLAVGYALPSRVQIEEYPADPDAGGSGMRLTPAGGVTVIRPLESVEPWAIKLYRARDGGQCHMLCGHTASVRNVVFSHDGKQLASTSDDGSVRIWNIDQERQVCSFETGSFHVNALSFSPDGKTLALAEGWQAFWGRIVLVDAKSGELLQALERHIGDVHPVVFSPDGRSVAMAGEDKVISLWRTDRTGGPLLLKGHNQRVFSLAVSPDGNHLASGSWDGTTRLWDMNSGAQLAAMEYHSRVWSVAFGGPKGELLASACEDGAIRLWNIGKKMEQGVLADEGLAKRTPYASGMVSVAFSPDGKCVAGGHATGTICFFDVDTRQILRTLKAHTLYTYRLDFSPVDNTLASGGYDQAIRLWDTTTGTLLKTLTGHQRPQHVEKGTSVAFRHDGKVLASGGTDGMLKLWDPATGKELSTFTGHTGSIASVKFNATGKVLAAGSNDATATLWNVDAPNEPQKICSLYSFPDDTWAVIDADGRFDASNGGDIQWLHWVVGLEPVELSQLKERYYDPGLLRKLFGYSTEPPRDVPALVNVGLHPAMEWITSDPAIPKARLRLTNRGGGIGRVVLSINGKEVPADARIASLDPQADQAELEIDFTDHDFLIPGESNFCEVKAYNAEGYLVSRSLRGVYQAPAKQIEPPHLWAIIAGTSGYLGEELALRFASKDAEDAARAVELGAQRLFGADNVHLTLLSTPFPSSSGHTRGQGQTSLVPPDRGTGHDRSTRKNIEEAFKLVAEKAKSTDVLVIYLAGHGISHGGQDGDYYYLTADALTGNLDDPAIRNLTAISSQELTDLIQQIPALKHVLILDTCAAGRLVEELTKRRSVSSSQMRALDRMKDRQGLYILAGSTADAVSYESSRYGQGLLTHSLLLGMRGAALREDEFVDVARLFEFATDQVPQLARGIGGIQRPLIAIPHGGASFDIGQLAETDKQQIIVPQALPMVLRANFQDETLHFDHLGLAKRVNSALRERSALGREAPLVFMDADDLPDAYALVGLYRLDGDTIWVAGYLFRSGDPAGDFEVEGHRAEVEQLVDRILEALLKKLLASG